MPPSKGQKSYCSFQELFSNLSRLGGFSASELEALSLQESGAVAVRTLMDLVTLQECSHFTRSRARDLWLGSQGHSQNSIHILLSTRSGNKHFQYSSCPRE